MERELGTSVGRVRRGKDVEGMVVRRVSEEVVEVGG